VETEVNAALFALLRRAFARTPPKDRMIRLEDRTVDALGPVRHQGLGSLRHLLAGDAAVRGAIKATSPAELTWWTLSLPRDLELLQDLRNPAAHSAPTRRDRVAGLRDQVLGIGSVGWIVQIARAKSRVA
jgi:hypothetical protein